MLSGFLLIFFSVGPSLIFCLYRRPVSLWSKVIKHCTSYHSRFHKSYSVSLLVLILTFLPCFSAAVMLCITT